jgi:hypothetical protein
MRCEDPFVRPRRTMRASTTVPTKLFKVVANPYSETPAPSARVETRPRVPVWSGEGKGGLKDGSTKGSVAFTVGVLVALGVRNASAQSRRCGGSCHGCGEVGSVSDLRRGSQVEQALTTHGGKSSD